MLVFNPSLKNPFNFLNSGFTLIELLVVMAILSIVMGLVGPLALNSVDKAQARTEVMTLTRWLDNLSYRAFLSQQEIHIELNGKQAIASSGLVDYVKSVDFDYLYFQPQSLLLNHNGFSQKRQIQYHFNEQTMVIQLNWSPRVE
ncbi:type II secretion system protein [Alteromonadaceae bacterium BrNp21-10]|nr:type II secretion system protein [Alteromonadaceae bacterium BrNp21-10]